MWALFTRLVTRSKLFHATHLLHSTCSNIQILPDLIVSTHLANIAPISSASSHNVWTPEASYLLFRHLCLKFPSSRTRQTSTLRAPLLAVTW